MDFSKTNIRNMALQTPDDGLINLGKWFITAIGAVIGFWKLVDKYFEDKKTSKKEFIAEVVKAAMQSELTQIKIDIGKLNDHRESDRKYFDEKFDRVMKK